jgi:hypothetical protein
VACTDYRSGTKMMKAVCVCVCVCMYEKYGCRWGLKILPSITLIWFAFPLAEEDSFRMSWCQRIFHNVELVRRAYLPVWLFFFLGFEAVYASKVVIATSARALRKWWETTYRLLCNYLEVQILCSKKSYRCVFGRFYILIKSCLRMRMRVLQQTDQHTVCKLNLW